MSAAEADVLAKLHAMAFSGSAMRPWSAEEIAVLMGTRGVTVLTEGGTPPDGFVMVRQVLDEAEILTLAVAPASQRRGIGGRLMERALHTLRSAGVSRLFLEVATGNTAARRLYASLGFDESGLRRGYFRFAMVDDAVTMVKALEP